MTPNYPNDSDGDALRRVAADGNDMNAAMVIDFPVVIPAENPAKQFASIASTKGYKVHFWKHDDDPDWDVICTMEVVPTYANIVRIQRELNEWAEPFRGYCDSWGTFGNKPGDQPAAR
jgi:hypothetical protein